MSLSPKPEFYPVQVNNLFGNRTDFAVYMTNRSYYVQAPPAFTRHSIEIRAYMNYLDQ